jgi:hypothetical protein
MPQAGGIRAILASGNYEAFGALAMLTRAYALGPVVDIMSFMWRITTLAYQASGGLTEA